MAKQARGYKTRVAVYPQTSLDQVPDPASGKYIYFTQFNLRGQQDLEESETLRGIRGRPEPDLGNINPNGGSTTEIDGANVGILLKQLFGEVATTGAGPYEHEFTVKDEIEESLLMEKDHGESISGEGRFERYLGVKVNSAQFNMPRSGYPTIQWDFLGADHALNENALDTEPDDTGFTPFSAFRAELLMDGSPIAVITEASATLANDLDDDQYVVGGAGKRVDIPEGFFLITGQLTARFTSADLLKKAIDAESISLQYTLQRGTGDGTAGNELFRLSLPRLRLQRNSPEIAGPRGVMVQMDFQGYEDAGELASAELKNQVDGY